MVLALVGLLLLPAFSTPPAYAAAPRKAGAEPVTDSSPDKTARFLRNEIARWTPIIKEAGLTQQ